MRWQGRNESSNVEDRRGIGGGGIVAGGGIIGVIALLLNYFLGGSDQPLPIPQGGGGGAQTEEQRAAEEPKRKFVGVVLRETELVWNEVLPKYGERYEEPKLVLFSGATQSGCGHASAQTGPFYCPGDSKVYIDLSFYDELQRRFGAPGDFAMAYVIAHEVGHHIQNLMGTSQKMQQLRGRVSETEYNRYSVKLELQADFLAGVWAHYVQGKGLLDEGDIEEALNAANQIGDDHLQREATGRVQPDGFTHGTSEQRMYWFRKGYESGDLRQGDTFSDPSLN